MTFLYDESGSVFGFTYKDAAYYYVKNLQGDIIGILNQAGEQITRYDYNAWGSPDMYDGQDFGEVGEANPLRYRGYYFDTETYMYYLNSRYYHPEYHRFISADSVLGINKDILSYNLFAYCSNNPVIFSDPSGMKMEPTNNWLVVALVTIGECAKVNHVYEITVARNREKGIEGGDMRVFDYPNGYNTVVDEIFSASWGLDLYTEVMGAVWTVASLGVELIDAWITSLTLGGLFVEPFAIWSYEMNILLTQDQKNSLILMDLISIGTPIGLSIAASNGWNPAGWVGGFICGATYVGVDIAKHLYLRSIKRVWESVL